jgi:hypothetical protein
MALKSRKVWLGIGAASLVGVASDLTAPAPAVAQHAGGHKTSPATAPAAAPATAPTSGQLAAPQGGEAYLTDGGPRDTRIRIYRDIALMRGHLLVGRDLIEQGLWDDALPHFLHPTEELYGAMERYIKLHKVTPFDRQLKALAQAVKAKNKAAYQQAAKVVDARLSNALDAFKKFMTVQPFSSYTARTIVEVLKVAKGEYEQAIDGERFAKPVEYQDGRGFVWYAGELLEKHAGDLEKIDAARLGQLRGLLADLKTAWPAAVPPEKPVIDAAALGTKVDAFAAAAERFF